MKFTAEDFAPSLDISERRINVDPETRRIAARIAGWKDVHSGFKGDVKSPRKVNVEAAHGGHAMLADGSSLPVANLSMGTLHADGSLSAEEARKIYEDTGTQIARGRYSTDEEGIRFDGVLFSDVDEPILERLTASAPSGDWRTFSHLRSMEDFQNAEADFVGAAIVNLPGFSGKYTQKSATPLRLIASGDESLILAESVPQVEISAVVDTGETRDATEDEIERGVASSVDEALIGVTVEQLEAELDRRRQETLTASASDETQAQIDLLTARLLVLEEEFARAVLQM